MYKESFSMIFFVMLQKHVQRIFFNDDFILFKIVCIKDFFFYVLKGMYKGFFQ